MKNEMRITPDRILEMGWAFAETRALATAVELDVFTHITGGKPTADKFRAAGVNELPGV